MVNFDDLSATPEAFSSVDVAFCCLGTTKGKAGKEGFIKVDHDYVVDSAGRLKEAGCKDFHLLTGMGAGKDSFFLYRQVSLRTIGVFVQISLEERQLCKSNSSDFCRPRGRLRRRSRGWDLTGLPSTGRDSSCARGRR